MRVEEEKKRFKVGWLELAAAVCIALAILVANANAARVKDVATLAGVSEQQLVGYGLVIGLAGTGDGSNSQVTVQSVANMLQKMGIVVSSENLRLRNVAAVMVTANLPAFVKPGKKIDVNISSIGDARSLEGGMLLMTPLQAGDGEYYAQAQGAVSVGGVTAGGRRNSVKKGHALSGSIPNGAIVYREVASANLRTGTLRWVLSNPDFTSAVAMANAINQIFPNTAIAEDASTVLVNVPEAMRNDYMSFIARAEAAEFNPNTSSRVILNEKTGTVVSGANVQIDQIAVSHGSITIQIENTQTATPTFIGQATVINNQRVNVQEPQSETRVLPAISNAGQLAQALNSLGVSPRDIISIFQAIKKAGALHAELVIM
ncbi:MAG: flagellar basal body P-ring protein FlgI [Fibromonadaceae bacterium]|jgi:flagellar P-ring protein precursor FlgI|nr:flagellar basal body P-ring protein FlgI [Fibromonadaceae bacterium]